MLLLSERVQPDFHETVCEETWKRHATEISCCSDTPEKKDMSGVDRGATLYPDIEFLVSRHHFRQIKMWELR